MNDTVESNRLAMTAKEAAKHLSIGERTLWSLTNTGEIPHVRIGKRVLYPVHLLREWLEERTEGGTS